METDLPQCEIAQIAHEMMEKCHWNFHDLVPSSIVSRQTICFLHTNCEVTFTYEVRERPFQKESQVKCLAQEHEGRCFADIRISILWDRKCN